MQKKDIQALLHKYTAGTCTEEEKGIVETWYLQYEDHAVPDLSESERAADLEEIRAALPQPRPFRVISLTTRFAAAASLIGFAFFCTWFFLYSGWPHREAGQAQVGQDVAPGGNNATLTLGDGTVISLDAAMNGAIAEQAGITISKTAAGQLIYAASPLAAGAGVKVNTIETPRGGQYQVVLPDGTRVWLNAASSLRFPTRFTGGERRVTLKGEAYFEVAHSKTQPFKVQSSNQEVEVLGTHFNVYAYAEEPVAKTTLLAGSVRIAHLKNKTSNLLVPGQQAVLAEAGIQVKEANLEEAVAWKNGYIVFENEKIESLMKKVARWYDVDIVYQGKITNNDFNGSVSRFENISKVLEILELTQAVHFKVEGRRVIVMP